VSKFWLEETKITFDVQTLNFQILQIFQFFSFKIIKVIARAKTRSLNGSKYFTETTSCKDIQGYVWVAK